MSDKFVPDAAGSRPVRAKVTAKVTADVITDVITDPAAAKAALRKTASKTRLAAAATHPTAADDLAAQAAALIARYGTGVYAAYLPIRSELSPLPLVAALQAGGVVTAMPVTPEPGQPLTFHQWAPGDALDDGPYGTTQPAANAPVVTPVVILAPMLAFDDGCWRLGYGGGFYDRTIGGLRAAGHTIAAIGLAYDEQHVDQVPTGSYDMALDGVLTPTGLRAARHKPARNQPARNQPAGKPDNQQGQA